MITPEQPCTWRRFCSDLDSVNASLMPGAEGFLVEEIPLYEPCGEGEHLWLWIEKTGMNTDAVVRTLARFLHCRQQDIGTAGNKDRRARACQYVSVRHAGDPEPLQGLDCPGMKILHVTRHRNKLRTGHIKGNRFRFVFASCREDDLRKARCVMTRLTQKGMPNWYGVQRFGVGQDNHLQGRRLLLSGGSAIRTGYRLKRLFLSAYQSYLFNRCLERRFLALQHIWRGDLAVRHPFHARTFLVQDAAKEQERADVLEISPTGPIFGAKMPQPAGKALAMERRILEEEALPQAIWQKRMDTIKLSGARRPYRIPVQDARVEREHDHLRVRFLLPPGSFASVVFRELTGEAMLMYGR